MVCQEGLCCLLYMLSQKDIACNSWHVTGEASALWHEDVWNVSKSLGFVLLEYPLALFVHWGCTLPGPAQTEQSPRSKCSKASPCWIGKCTNREVCVYGRASCITALRSAQSAIKYSNILICCNPSLSQLKSMFYSIVQLPLCCS